MAKETDAELETRVKTAWRAIAHTKGESHVTLAAMLERVTLPESFIRRVCIVSGYAIKEVVRWELEVSYPTSMYPQSDAVVEAAVGKPSGDTGIGMGYRDLNFSFTSAEEADAAKERVVVAMKGDVATKIIEWAE